MRIGALLGKGEAHRPKKTSPASEVYDIAKDDRHKFRQLYERPKAKERQGTRTDKLGEKFTPSSDAGKVRDKIGEVIGMSG